MGMGSMETLRTIGRNHFTWPRSSKIARRRVWRVFAFYWLWSLATAVPGALAAAYLIGQAHLTDQWLQDVLAVAFAFLSLVLIPILVVAVALVADRCAAKFEHLELERIQGELALLFVSFLLVVVLFLLVSPFELAAYALYWYFAHPSDAFTLAATGAGGALVLKAVVILCNAVVIPVCEVIFGKRLKHLLFGDKAKPRGA